MSPSKATQVLELAAKIGVITPKELQERAMSSALIWSPSHEPTQESSSICADLLKSPVVVKLGYEDIRVHLEPRSD